MTGVAFVRRSPVTGNLALKIRVYPLQMMAGRTLPDIELVVKDKARMAILFGTPMHPARQPLEQRRDRHQKQRVSGGQQDFDVDTLDHSPAFLIS